MNIIRKIWRKLLYYFSTPEQWARFIGVNVGSDNLLSKDTWSSEPYLITVGSHCQLTNCKIFTHGGGQVVRHIDPTFDSFGKVTIGDYVYIGTDSLIMPGVTIGDHTLVAAGSVVTKSCLGGGSSCRKSGEGDLHDRGVLREEQEVQHCDEGNEPEGEKETPDDNGRGKVHPEVRTFTQRVVGKLIHLAAPILPDDLFLKLVFRNRVGYPLNLKNPQTFNEKLQWLKLNDIHEEYTMMVDKVAAKQYVAGIIGDEYIIPTLGVWNDVEDVEWEKLPNRFVIKSANDSGGVVVCKDKASLDIEAAKEKLKRCGGRTYSNLYKEYPYRNVPKRIIAEEYKEDESGVELKDYKIFCFDGKPYMVFVASDRQIQQTKFDFYDLEWNHLPIIQEFPNNPKGIKKPKNLEKMLEIAGKLSKGIPHVRVDLYNCDGNIYFGELTFFHNSGIFPWYPKEWDYKLGEQLVLPVQNKTGTLKSK